MDPCSSVTGVLIAGEIWVQTEAWGECHAKRGVMSPWAKNLPEAERGLKQVLAENLQREHSPANSLISASGLQTMRQ